MEAPTRRPPHPHPAHRHPRGTAAHHRRRRRILRQPPWPKAPGRGRSGLKAQTIRLPWQIPPNRVCLLSSAGYVAMITPGAWDPHTAVHHPRRRTTPMATSDLAAQFHTALSNGDADTLASLVTPDVTFSGPLARASGAEDVVKGLTEMGAMTTSDDVAVQLADDDNALTWSVLKTTVAPSTPAATWLRFEGGKIAEIQTVFNAGR
ncbi:nuclear transport factor 2 family protein [Brevibacterium sp. LS14]|nr:nuclear transport factor 2 family protein [Brevibacterium sp. LS14]